MKEKTVCVLLNYCDKNNCVNIINKGLADGFFDHYIIVDNNSPDNSFEELKKLGNDTITVIKAKENKGFASGNNIGIAYAIKNLNPRYIVCLGTDVIVEKKALEKCYSVLEKNDNLACVSPMMLDRDKNIDSDFAWDFQTFSDCLKFNLYLTRKKNNYKKHKIIDYSKELVLCDVIRGSFMFFKADILERIGMFDEHTFLFYEENIICKKISDISYNVGFITTDTYIHNHIQHDTRSKQKYRESMKSAYYYLVKYQHIGFIKRVIFKLTSSLGKMEYFLFSKLKKK